jgi:hypothetical protein
VDGFNDEDIAGECSDGKALWRRESGGRQWEDKGQQRDSVMSSNFFDVRTGTTDAAGRVRAPAMGPRRIHDS